MSNTVFEVSPAATATAAAKDSSTIGVGNGHQIKGETLQAQNKISNGQANESKMNQDNDSSNNAMSQDSKASNGDVSAAMAALLRTVDSTITNEKINKLMESKDPTLDLLQQHLLTSDYFVSSTPSSSSHQRQQSISELSQNLFQSSSDFMSNFLKSGNNTKEGVITEDMFKSSDSVLKDLWRTIERSNSMSVRPDTPESRASRDVSSIVETTLPQPIDANSKVSLYSSSDSSNNMPPPIPSGQNIRKRNISDSLKLLQSNNASCGKLPSGLFASQEWAQKYAPAHVEVDVDKVFQSETPSEAPASSILPSSINNGSNNAAGKGITDWEALYEVQLSAGTTPKPKQSATGSSDLNNIPLTSASSTAGVKTLAADPNLIEEEGTLSTQSKNTTTPKSLPTPVADAVKSLTTHLPASKVIPAAVPSKSVPSSRRNATSSSGRTYVTITDADVLLGRGGRTNNHVGNKRYLQEKDRIQERYMIATKTAKTGISQELVDIVHDWGGRFLKMDANDDQWYEVTNTVARKKCSQSLREINTPEERAAKRAKYGK